MAKIIGSVHSTTDYNEEEDRWDGKIAKPCSCGSTQLEQIEVRPAQMNDQQQQVYPARTAVRCTVCKKTGIDTCHGKEHAIRRWNWY